MSLLTNLLDGIGRFDQFYYGPCLVSLYFPHEPGHAFVPDTQLIVSPVSIDLYYRPSLFVDLDLILLR